MLCLLCLLAVRGAAQERLYFRLIVEDSGKRHTVQVEDCFLADSGRVIHPVFSKRYGCMDAVVKSYEFSICVKHNGDTLVIPGVWQNLLFGEEWVLQINPLAESSSWRIYYQGGCMGGVHTTGTCSGSRASSKPCQFNEVAKTDFLYESTWVDYYGDPIIIEVGKPQRPRSTFPHPNSTDIFLGPKPSEYFSLWPEN